MSSFIKLVAPLAEEMGVAFPELKAAQEQVERVLKKKKSVLLNLGASMKFSKPALPRWKALSSPAIPCSSCMILWFPVDLTVILPVRSI